MNLNLNFDKLQSINELSLSDEKARKRIVDYLYQLTEQLRYWQNNIGLENLDSDAQQRIGSIVTNTEMMASQISDIDGNISTIMQTIDQFSVAISQKADGNPDGSAQAVQSGSVSLTATDFEVGFDGNTAMHVDANSAGFYVDDVEVSGHITGDVVNRTIAGITWTGTAAQAQSVIDKLPKYIAHTVTLNIGSGTSGTINFLGFIGPGSINVNITGVIQGRLRFRFCDCEINVVSNSGNNPTVYYLQPQDAGVEAITVVGCPRVNISGLGIMGKSRTSLSENNTDGIGASNSHVWVQNCLIDKCRRAMAAYRGASIYASGVKGGVSSGGAANNNQNYRAAYASEAGTIVLNNQYPCGESLEEYQDTGTIKLGTQAVQTASDGTTPTNPDPDTYTFTAAGSYQGMWANAAGSGSYSPSTCGWTKAKPRQGLNAGEYYSGIWYFDAEDLSVIQHLSSISTATVTLTRDTAQGSENAVNVKLFYCKNAYTAAKGPTSTTAPASILVDTGINAQAVARGGSVTFTLTNDLKTKLLDGTIKGFGLASSSLTSFVQMTATGCVLNITT